MGRHLLAGFPDYAAMRAGFRWDVPAHFNIAERCCDSWAAADPARPAIIDVGEDGARRVWSYGDLNRASAAFAGALAARGIGRGDRVAVLLAQSAEVMVCHMAIYRLGAVVLPLFTLFGAEALAYRLADSGAKAAITDGANLDKLMALRHEAPELAEIWCTGPAPPPARDFRADIATGQRVAPVDTAAEDPAVLIYTSGTTGPPKGVLHAHRFLIGHLTSVETHHPQIASAGDVGWTPADWAWIGGLMDMAMPCLYYGVPLVAQRMRKFDPDAAFRLIRDEGVTRLFLPPTALRLMRQAGGQATVRSVGSGGESLGPDLSDWARGALGAPINEFYGQTECNLVLSACHGLTEVKPGSMGLPVPGHDVALIDAEGQPVPAGDTGEIAVRRPDPAMFLDYWRKPDKTAEKFAGDWMRTGDLARQDAEGHFFYVSRDDDVITSAGYRIGPTEIEACLTGHPDVVMAAAVGVPDAVRTEVVHAYVVLRAGVVWEGLEEALIARVRDKVSPHVAPRRITPIDEMPMTATGKIMRRALRAG